MLYRELDAVEKFRGVRRQGGILCHGLHHTGQVESTVIARSILVGAVLGCRKIIGRVADDEHRHSREIGLEDSQPPAGSDPGALPDNRGRLSGKLRVRVRHGRRAALLPDQNGLYSVLLVHQTVEKKRCIPPRDAENMVDSRLDEDIGEEQPHRRLSDYFHIQSSHFISLKVFRTPPASATFRRRSETGEGLRSVFRNNSSASIAAAISSTAFLRFSLHHHPFLSDIDRHRQLVSKWTSEAVR